MSFAHVEECERLSEARAWLCANHPKVILLDTSFSFSSTTNGLAEFCEDYRSIPVAVLDNRRDWPSAFNALEAGAKGFIPRGLGEAQFRCAISQLIAGNAYIPSRMNQGEALAGMPEHLNGNASAQRLTDRQREVLVILASGKSNKEIARALAISESTVKVHIAAAFRLLGVHNRVSAMAKLRASQLSHLVEDTAQRRSHSRLGD